jgi:hypothetical protein
VSGPVKVGLAQHTLRRALLLVAVAVVIAFLVVLHLRLARYPYDDAFIHLRIAGNLVDHGLPHYNLGEVVHASSSVLWTLAAAGATAVSGNPLVVLAIVNALLLATASALAGMFMSRLIPGAGLPPVVAVAVITGAALLPATGGVMETGLAMALVLGGYLLVGRGRLAGFLLLGLAVGARLEAVVFVGLALAWWWKGGRRPVAAFAFSAVGLVPLLLYGIAWFGTVVPQPVAAKAFIYGRPVFPEQFGTMMSPGLGDLENGLLLCVGIGLCAAVTAVPLGESLGSLRWLGVAFSVSGAIVALAYVALAGLVFPWYSPLYLVPMAFAGIWLFCAKRGVTSGLALVLVATPIVIHGVGLLGALAGRYETSQTLHVNARVAQYRSIGHTLDAACPECRLLTTEIGGLGEGFGGNIVDAAGLVTPAALGYHPLRVPEERASHRIGAIPPRFVEAAEPDLIVSYEVFAQALAASEPIRDYTAFVCPPLVPEDLTRDWPPTVFGSDYLMVWARGLRTRRSCAPLGPV